MRTQTSTPVAPTELYGPMMQMLTGYWVSQAIYSAARLGVSDLLKDGPMPVIALATSLKANEDFLYRLLRALASLGILSEEEEKTFRLTSMGELLRGDVPDSIRPVALMMGEEHYTAWGKLSEGVVSGKTPFENVYDMDVFEYFEKNPRAGDVFNQAMTALVRNELSAVVSAYDFSRFTTLVDVGGGHGLLMAAILRNNPCLNGVVFDLPHVVEGATAQLKTEGVETRGRAEGGDFFSAVPEGDGYIMSHIIHDWSDELSTRILANIHKAMKPDGLLLLAETVITPGNQPCMGKLMDLNMMVMTSGGRERTEEEYRTLLTSAGFRLTRVIPVTPTVSILEAVKQ